MKTIKPLRLGILHRVFENGPECKLAVTILAYFPFDAPRQLLTEVELWKSFTDDTGGEVPLDECMPKATGEVLVTGRAYPPGNGPQPVCAVRLKLDERIEYAQATGRLRKPD